MLLKIPNNKKSTNTINNNYFSYFKEIKLDQYNNYNPKINKSKTKKKKFTLNPTSHNSKRKSRKRNISLNPDYINRTLSSQNKHKTSYSNIKNIDSSIEKKKNKLKIYQ